MSRKKNNQFGCGFFVLLGVIGFVCFPCIVYDKYKKVKPFDDDW